MIPPERYRLHSSIESFGESGEYGVKILVARPHNEAKRYDKEINTPDSKMFEQLERMPDAEKLLQFVIAQDRMLDPELEAYEESVRRHLEEAFEAAGLTPIFMAPIENRYPPKNDPYAVRNPWYRVATKLGFFIVGWRKHVLELQWHETALKAGAQSIFKDEKTTVAESYIHAWGYKNLVKYLAMLKAWGKKLP